MNRCFYARASSMHNLRYLHTGDLVLSATPSCADTHMTHIFDLDDDVLVLTFQFVRDYSPFTSLVCSRFCRLVTQAHFPYPRRASVGILMHRTETFKCYAGNSRVVDLLQGPQPPSLRQEWSKLARIMVVVHGTKSMIRCVLGDLTCEAALQYGRVDMLEAMAVHKHRMSRLRTSVQFFAESRERSRNRYDTSYTKELTMHCERTLITACYAPSSVSLEWIKSKVTSETVFCRSNWNFIWSRLGGISQRIVLCAASQGTEDTLDCILKLFMEHAPPDKTLILDGMCAIVVMSRTRSPGAWKWLHNKITRRMETLDRVLDRVASAMQRKESTHLAFSNCFLDVKFVDLNTFSVSDASSYQIVKEGVSHGGWLRRAFFNACGCGANFTSMCLFCNMNVSTLSLHYSHAYSFEALVVECTKDMAKDYVLFDACTRCFVIKALQVTSELSVGASYDVAIHVAQLAIEGALQKERRDDLLYGCDFLGVVLANSVRRSRSSIVEDTVSKPHLFCLDKIAIDQRMKLAFAVSSSTSRASYMKQIASCVSSFYPITMEIMKPCISRRNRGVFAAFANAASKSVKLEIGCEIVKQASVELLEDAISMDCFERDSEEEKTALQLLTQHNIGYQPHRKRPKRMLPFRTTGTNSRSAGRIHARNVYS